jgi:predicted acylesterase/phospholipase RssA
MSKIESIDDVKYLVFEGGGGKGVLFLGALEAFESSNLKGILPIGSGNSQIKGLAGSSIGALFAYLLALGWSKKKIENLWFNSKLPLSILDHHAMPDSFTAVISDGPTQVPRSPEQKFYKEGDSVAEREAAQKVFRDSRIKSIRDYLLLDKLFPSVTASYLSGFVTQKIAQGVLDEAILPSLTNSTNPIIKHLVKGGKDGLINYIYCLVFDRGFYSGFALRNFIKTQVGGTIASFNFEDLFAKTQIHLAVTGTNTSGHFPAYFSHLITPKFPVLDAVVISMHYPILFKPVWVEATKNEPEGYTGFWVDGGYLNNLPIHAFDDDADEVENEGLNPNVLAIRIVEKLGTEEITAKKLQLKTIDPGEHLARHLEDLLETLLYPSEPGQLRTPSEEEQTIQLFSEDLKTLVFETDEDKTKTPIFHARIAVEDYFSPLRIKGDCEKPSRQLAPKQFEELVRQEVRKKYKYVSRGEITIHAIVNPKTQKATSEWFRVDVVATNGNGKYVLFEAKSSLEAPLTKNQQRFHSVVKQNGGIITSSGNKQMDYGTVLKAQEVIIVKPSNYCEEIKKSKPV